jgi:methionyl-tRNA formyltransferase
MALRIAIFGQAAFGKDVAIGLAEQRHEIAAVYAPPSASGRPDPLAAEAETHGWPLFRHARFRSKGEAIPELINEYRGLGIELNVMPFTTVILPPEIVGAPVHGSLCFHPSLLPAYRGGAALAWQIILGARETGVTVFRPDAGVDTGPIVVQKSGVRIDSEDTAGSLYFDKLYALGVAAVLEAVDGVDRGTAVPRPQREEGSSFQGLVTEEVARIDWSLPAVEIDRLIRGCDPQPGAHAVLGDRTIRLFGSRLRQAAIDAAPGTVLGLEGGRLVVAAKGGALEVARLRVGEGKKTPAAEAGVSRGVRLA